MANKNIIIITGGTGGHIFPARATAAILAEKGYKITIFGDKKYAAYHQQADNFKYQIICSSQVEKNISLIPSAFKIVYGILQSFFRLIFLRPAKVVAFGGHSTFPSLVAAIILKKPIILHEQNSHLGKVNRIFAKHAKVIALSYPQTLGIENKYQLKTKFTGNPIRKEMAELSKIDYILPDLKKEKLINENNLGYDVLLASQFNEPPKAANNNFNILIIGGSGGARIFSEILPKAFFNIREELKNRINITQQCRKEDFDQLYSQYNSFNLNVCIKSFFKDMEERIKKAHLIIARAGSSSIAEFTTAKKPMILIPFARASDNHQEKNALFVEKMGGAILIREKDLTINKITDNIEKLIDNPELLQRMSRLSFACATNSATENLAELIENVV